MALMARLEFGDNLEGIYSSADKYLVLDFHLHFSRRHNHFKPNTDARCDKIEVVVVAPGRQDLRLYDWYINNETMSGRLVIELQSVASDSTIMKEIKFEDAYCYSIKEDYRISEQRRRVLTLSLVAEKIEINESEFKNLFAV